jgi:hypothetical protein
MFEKISKRYTYKLFFKKNVHTSYIHKFCTPATVKIVPKFIWYKLYLEVICQNCVHNL